MCQIKIAQRIVYDLNEFAALDVPENENSFTDGWTFLGRKRDDYDDEWESFVEHITSYIYWYICHVSISEIVRLLDPSVSNKQMQLFSLQFRLKILFQLYSRKCAMPMLQLDYYLFCLTSIHSLPEPYLQWFCLITF